MEVVQREFDDCLCGPFVLADFVMGGERKKIEMKSSGSIPVRQSHI
jgi:hypothetical protein